MNTPPCAKGAFGPTVYGKMFPPGLLANGSEKLEAANDVVPPNGGEFALLTKSCPLLNSYARPYEARMESLPCPVGSHAAPTRGANRFHCRFIPESPGNPVS